MADGSQDHLDDELSWEPPGAGQWWLELEHFPRPVCGLFADLFPPTVQGWIRGGRRYGLLMGEPRWAAVNGWLYYSSSPPDREDLPSAAKAARETLDQETWRDEITRWREVERPQVVATNELLQSVKVAALADDQLYGHLIDCLVHFRRVSPLHFEHRADNIVLGLFLEALDEAHIDASSVLDWLSVGRGTFTATVPYLDRIADALDEAQAEPARVIADIEGAGVEPGSALADYLARFGWRLLTSRDIGEPTLIEQPEVVVAAVEARRGRRSRGVAAVPFDQLLDAVPAERRRGLQDLLEAAREAYSVGDDDEAECLLWPGGLIRRALLELGPRLVRAGRLQDGADLFEASGEELGAMASGGGPAASELAERARTRQLAATTAPPPSLGEPIELPELGPLPEPVARLREILNRPRVLTGRVEPGSLVGSGVGQGSYRGRARLVETDPAGLASLEPGDVLVVSATTPAYNAVFPIVGAVVTAFGGAASHAAILARELGIPAVIGVADALVAIPDGAMIEVDASAGRVRLKPR